MCEFAETPEVVRSPQISAESDIFCDELEVIVSRNISGVEIRYTLDGSDPVETSDIYQNPIVLDKTATVKCRIFRDGYAISPQAEETFEKVQPRPAEKNTSHSPGLKFNYYEGEWEKMPDFESISPIDSGYTDRIDLSPQKRKDHFALFYAGYLTVERRGVYTFALTSDDGSRLFIGKNLVVDNDGLHGPRTVLGRIALEAGAHPITLQFFQRSGGVEFEVKYSGPGVEEQIIPPAALSHARSAPN